MNAMGNGEIYKRMAAVMAKIGAISKDSTNQQQGFKYRSIDSVYNALNPLLAEQGIFTMPEVLDARREERTTPKGTVLMFTCLRMKYTFYAPDGSSVFCIVEGEGMDSGDKSSNKAMAIAHKYALLQAFCVPTEEQKDPDAEVHEVAPDPKLGELISDLEAAAAQGREHFIFVWQALQQEERERVGAAEFNRLKKLLARPAAV